MSTELWGLSLWLNFHSPSLSCNVDLKTSGVFHVSMLMCAALTCLNAPLDLEKDGMCFGQTECASKMLILFFADPLSGGNPSNSSSAVVC